MRRWLLISLLGVLGSTIYAQSVAQRTGNPPRFPKAYKELEKQTKPPSSNWLLDANDDTERFRRLQVVLGGTEVPMMEIGYRFEQLYEAILKNNWEMATYHWEKLRDRMNNAAMKRPARTQNLEGMFLESGIWKDMHDVLKAGSAEKVRAQFLTVRQACMACHVAERMGFLNDNPVFAKTAQFSPVMKK